ncbi:MAG: ATP-binding protein [Chloroflexota bacterium]
MKFSLYAIIENHPPQFSFKEKLTQKDLRGGVFALLTDDMAKVRHDYGHLFERITGIIITISPEFGVVSITPLLWQITIPPQMQANLATLATSYLSLLHSLRTVSRQQQIHEIELNRAQAELMRVTDYAAMVQGKLRNQLRQYSAWTVNALTSLLKFEALQTKRASMPEIPGLIVDFLLSDVFDYSASAILQSQTQSEQPWEIVAQAGNWYHKLDLADCCHSFNDLWQDGNELYVPFVAANVQYIIVISKNKQQANFSEYEFTFFQLLSTLMVATYESKVLENERQHELAERTRAEEALARALRTKDEFLANMSHELRTPLNAVLGQTQILQEGVHGTLTQRQMRALGIVEESSLHLLSLIDDILDLAKLDAVVTRLDIEDINITAVCQSSLRMVKEIAQRRQLKVFSTIDFDAHAMQADKRRLKQILINLLSNAIKFTDPGGHIGLEVLHDSLQGQIHFTVWDTGIGIAQEDMNKLFEPFVQVDSGLSRRYEGTGLGLALVKRLTTMHQGHISVESNIGQGSRFKVSLPLIQTTEPLLTPSSQPSTSPPPKIATEPTPTKNGSAHILLAEDNITNVETMRDILEFIGYRVTVAQNGREAISCAETMAPDLILMDVQMPVMDGIEATMALRKNAQTKDIPIIALTGMAMANDQERCLDAGCNDFLTKPIHLPKLKQMLKTFLT